ncbi:hypothetical protein [Thiomicrorhabdus sp. Kp2]|uniref:hypothetical protein n=1 Tax=Thiomicrorhabdus sp. Kp2 TaxID=1123518 RepID=UPI000401BC82|nr:hypothetical protein [Thiomicrorhabdus sp. Kp2]
MSKQENHKIQIAYEVVEKYNEHEDQEDFEESVLEIVELDEEGFARGIFVSLQVIRGYASNSSAETHEVAKELVESVGGIEFLEQYLETDSEVDVETIDWYKTTFN